MPRRPSVRYFPSRMAYYCQIKGRQVPLGPGPDDFPDGPNYKAALRKFCEESQLASADIGEGQNHVRTILELYLRHHEHKIKPKTYKMRVSSFKSFAREHGDKRVGDLKPLHIDEWIMKNERPAGSEDKQHGWTQGTIRIHLSSIKAAFTWAKEKGYIPADPFATVKLPEQTRRGDEAIISPATHARALQIARKDLRLFLQALEHTGARPSELAAATAKVWRDDLGGIVYPRKIHVRRGDHTHKNARHDQQRVILFTGEMLEVMRELVSKRPTGPLFMTCRGKTFNERILDHRLSKVKETLGDDDYTFYGYRHTFATNWLKAGKSIDVLAELLGNSASTLRKHYSHLLTDITSLRSHLEDFRQ